MPGDTFTLLQNAIEHHLNK